MAKKKSELQSVFDSYNQRFFNGELYDVEVKWSKGKKLTIDKEDVAGVQISPHSLYKPQEIILAKWLKRQSWLWRFVLLHEMCHQKLSLEDCHGAHDHGVEFNTEMLRIAKIGGFHGIW